MCPRKAEEFRVWCRLRQLVPKELPTGTEQFVFQFGDVLGHWEGRKVGPPVLSASGQEQKGRRDQSGSSSFPTTGGTKGQTGQLFFWS